MNLLNRDFGVLKLKSAYSGNLKTTKCQISFPVEVAYQCALELKALGVTQIIDSSEGIFDEEIKRCEESSELIESIEIQIRKECYEIAPCPENVEVSNQNEIDEIRAKLTTIHDELAQIRKNIDYLHTNEIRSLDLKTILEVLPKYGMSQNFNGKLRHEEQLEFLTGLIKARKKTDFEAFTRRMSRAQVFLKLIPIQSDVAETKVFVLFFSGEEQKAKVQKICDGFQSKCYKIPESPDDRPELLARISRQADQMKSIIKNTSDYRAKIMRSTGESLMKWKSMNQKFKEGLLILNKFSMNYASSLLIGECWIPQLKIEQINNCGTSKRSELMVTPVFENMDRFEIFVGKF